MELMQHEVDHQGGLTETKTYGIWRKLHLCNKYARCKLYLQMLYLIIYINMQTNDKIY